jgi:hypothetical protein
MSWAWTSRVPDFFLFLQLFFEKNNIYTLDDLFLNLDPRVSAIRCWNNTPQHHTPIHPPSTRSPTTTTAPAAPISISAASPQHTNLPFELLFQFQTRWLFTAEVAACPITGTTCKSVHLGGTTRWRNDGGGAINVFYSENKSIYTKMVRHFLPVCLILYIIPLASSHDKA